MTKLRAPLSTEQALARIAGRVAGGYDGMGEVCGRAAHTVRAWGDPDKEGDIPFGCAEKLDLAYQAAGGEGAPLFESYAARLELAQVARFSNHFELIEHAQGVIKEGGEAHAAIVRALKPGADHSVFREAYREAAEAFEKLRVVLPFLEAQAQPP